MVVNPEDFRSNSNKSKEALARRPEKKVEKVVTGKATVKKRGKAKKFVDVFIDEDIRSVKEFLFSDVLVPKIRDTIYDLITGGADMILYGGTRGTSKKSSGGSYSSYSQAYTRRADRSEYQQKRDRFDLDEIIFESRGDAERVLDDMDNILESYTFVTVADMYDLADISQAPYTANKYGWTKLGAAEVVRVRTDNGFGYSIKLPRPQLID